MIITIYNEETSKPIASITGVEDFADETLVEVFGRALPRSIKDFRETPANCRAMTRYRIELDTFGG